MSGCDKSVLQCSCSDTVRCGCRQTAQVNHKSLLFSFVCLLLWFCWFADLFLLILMRATSITWAIGRGGGGAENQDFFGWQWAKWVPFGTKEVEIFRAPHPLPMALAMDLPTSKSLSPSAFGLGLGKDLIWINWVIFWRSWCSLLSAGGFSQLERKTSYIFLEKTNFRFNKSGLDLYVSGLSTTLNPDWD